MFSSPPRGSLISIHENLTAELPGSSSRPLHGVLLSQFKPILFIWQTRWMFSSPPRGSLISICAPAPDLRLQTCSRPLHGVLLSQWLSALLVTPAPQVLVPSTGFSYLNYTIQLVWLLLPLFSSPPRGSLISIIAKTIWSLFLIPSSRPLHGVLLSQLEVFFKVVLHSCSRPLHGVLLSQYCPLHLSKHKAFIPHLRGKPANERNLNIKLDHTDHKA